ncbi:MAG: sulfatase [Lentisphaerae bacterium]|jgi:arylsulfatase A-like enzyme|nr:sulfatase [Lentisphaerota bacterium]
MKNLKSAVSAPNIILIVADDFGWRDTACYGSTFYETPALDRLAREGVRFDNAYATCPVCSPSRASLMTGKYPARVGITDWIDNHGSIHPTSGLLTDAPYLKGLPNNETTLASALRQGGYQTWHIGKWHLGGAGQMPEDHGFDINIGGCEVGSPGRGGYFSPWTIPNLPGSDLPPGTHITDYLTDRALELIEQRHPDKPFFLNFWHYDVHMPHDAKPHLTEKYREKAHRLRLDQTTPIVAGEHFPCNHKSHLRVERRLIQSDPEYAAMVENMDTNIGRLLEALDRLDLAKNTIVIFTSDNGGLATSEGSPTSNLPLAEGKGWMYDGGVREPLIVRWPGVTNPDSLCHTITTGTDIYPTLLDAAGLPARPEQHLDGCSILPALRGDTSVDRGPIYWHYPHYGNQGGTPAAAIRHGNWKLILWFEHNRTELYNLADDISECNNLASIHPEIVATMSDQLHVWLSEVNAILPLPTQNSERS